MRTRVILGLAAIVAAVAAVKILQPHHDVTIVMQENGVKSLISNKIEFIDNGEFKINQVVLKKANGETYFGSKAGPTALDAAHQTVTMTLPWGTVKVNYAASANRLNLTINTTNTSDSETIQGLLFQPLTLKFPGKVAEYDGSIPLLSHNLGNVGLVKVSYRSGALAVVGEDLDKPLMLGFPWALDRPNNTVFPLSVHTDRVNNYPDSYPVINRPIPPKGTDQYSLSLRFGSADATETELAGDVLKKFGDTFQTKLNWKDHRPIGAIFLATASPSSPTNPEGWFGDSHVNVTTPAGRTEFRQRVMALADSAVSIMKSMNAQGAITWDIEGQKYNHAISYIGDPRALGDLAPEMNEIADEYFARIRDAGLRIGICVRPQQLTKSADGKTVVQAEVDDPAKLLIDKIRYAKDRWKVTIVYVDSNANPVNSNPMDAAVLQKVAEAFPDVLLVPEHATLRYYAYSAPATVLRTGGLGTSDSVHAVYPNAFSVIYTADGALDLYKKTLVRSAKQGDILMYRTWYPDPQNDKVKALLNP